MTEILHHPGSLKDHSYQEETCSGAGFLPATVGLGLGISSCCSPFDFFTQSHLGIALYFTGMILSPAYVRFLLDPASWKREERKEGPGSCSYGSTSWEPH